jgi:Restriction endonuclease
MGISNFMTPYEFEFAVEDDFRNQGFNITHVGKSFDKGVDFIAENSDQRIAIQVKMYENRIVRYQEFMYLYAGQKLYDCTKSVLITTNAIDGEAKKVAAKLGVDYFENYVTDYKIDTCKLAKQHLDSNKNRKFFEVWQKYIKPLKGKVIYTVTGKENLITDVTNDYLFRKASTGNTSKIEYKIFETIYHRLVEIKQITQDEINTEYTKRASAIITVVLSQIPNIELIEDPKIGLRLID